MTARAVDRQKFSTAQGVKAYVLLLAASGEEGGALAQGGLAPYEIERLARAWRASVLRSLAGSLKD
jgi:hypothetical protein